MKNFVKFPNKQTININVKHTIFIANCVTSDFTLAETDALNISLTGSYLQVSNFCFCER